MAATYKCTSVGCYSYQSPETNTLLQRLQTVINQFAQAVAFAPLKVDGIIGKGTTEAALLVLGYLGEIDKGVVGSSAQALESQINTPEQLVLGAQAVADTLTLATKQSAIAAQTTPPTALPPPSPKPSPTQIATSTANAPTKTTSPASQNRINSIRISNPALATSLVDRVPPWAAYVGGAALAVGTLVAVIAAKKRKAKALPPVSGRSYY